MESGPPGNMSSGFRTWMAHHRRRCSIPYPDGVPHRIDHDDVRSSECNRPSCPLVSQLAFAELPRETVGTQGLRAEDHPGLCRRTRTRHSRREDARATTLVPQGIPGARGGIRTPTPPKGQRILSPTGLVSPSVLLGPSVCWTRGFRHPRGCSGTACVPLCPTARLQIRLHRSRSRVAQPGSARA